MPNSSADRPRPPAPGGRAEPVLRIQGLSKSYKGGPRVLDDINLSIEAGEIFALLGPNGAGKTTLISIVCGIVNPGEGEVRVGGFDIVRDYRRTRALIGLVPQELTTDAFETVWATVSFSRGLFGLPPNPDHVERILRQLSLWEKRDAKILTLSGGMKRRVLIAKALAHEPRVLFLDEPTAGVDVRLRQDMWQVVRDLRAGGVTVILTTHYIEEAEEMADRVGVIRGGRLVLVDEKTALMRKLGRKELALTLQAPLAAVPPPLAAYDLSLSGDGTELTYVYDSQSEQPGISRLLEDLAAAGIRLRDVTTRQSTLEDIFVSLVETRA